MAARPNCALKLPRETVPHNEGEERFAASFRALADERRALSRAVTRLSR
jgi:hypothetical protein